MKLLQPITIGNRALVNRIAMAPMTRSRADQNGLVGDITVEYYAQRATAGLIISEGINISKQALGSPNTPGLFTEEQVNAWRKVTNAVHDKGGVMYAQLWHTGRVGHSTDKNGALPVAPSAIAIQGQQHFTTQGPKNYETPKALATEEVKQIVEDYKIAAKNAMAAGFDGVELHAAFGYLPNQFLVESANQRNDEYGGDIENRCRFILEVMMGLHEICGDHKVGIKLSPSIPFNSIVDSNPIAVYTHLLAELNKIELAYVHLMNALFPTDHLPQYPRNVLETFGKHTKHIIIANGGYSRDLAEQELERGIAKIISFGAPYIANPDLALRFELNAPLNTPDKSTMYAGGSKGYTDYPFFNQ